MQRIVVLFPAPFGPIIPTIPAGGNLKFKSSYNNSVLLKDIAEIKFKEKEVTTYAREKGKPVVMLVVKKRSGENTLRAVEKIRSIVEKNIENIFPQNNTLK